MDIAEDSFVPASALEASVLLTHDHYQLGHALDSSQVDAGLPSALERGDSSLESPHKQDSNARAPSLISAPMAMLSIEEKRRKKESIRAMIAQVRGAQDDEDFDTYMRRDEHIKQSVAITDILLSGRLPFLVKGPGSSAAATSAGSHGPKSRAASPSASEALSKATKAILSSSSQSVTGGSNVSSGPSGSGTPVRTPVSRGAAASSKKASDATARARSVSQDLQSIQSGSSSAQPSVSRLPALTKAANGRGTPTAQGGPSKKMSLNAGLRVTTTPARPVDEFEELLAQERSIPSGGLIDGLVSGGSVAASKFHALMTNFTRTLPKHENRTADGKLQYVLEQLNKVKTDLDPCKIYFEAGIIFYEMNVYERAVVCLEKSTRPSDAARIVDTLCLPNDVHYQRKVERMSPLVLPKFLAERQQLRDRLVFEESERQRLRVQAAHCELCRIRCLVPEVRDLWKAHAHIEQAFRLCHGPEEHYEALLYFHRLISTFTTDVLKEHTEFQRSQQVVRASAGPLSDAHVTILLDLTQFEPANYVYHEWLGRRYTEKCLFEEASHHYEQARALRQAKPQRDEVLQLWRKKPQESDDQAEAMAAAIHRNVHKAVLQTYQNYDGDIYELARRDAAKDLSHFPGKHDDMCTVLYTPPPQGWTGQK